MSTQRQNNVFHVEFEPPFPFPEKMVVFGEHKEALLAILRKVHRRKSSEAFDADQSWRELTELARDYFTWQKCDENNLSARECIKRLREINRAFRQASGLARRALDDGVGDELFRARCFQKKITYKDGSTVLMRVVDEIKLMVEALATLEGMSQVAVNNYKPPNTGRPTLLARDCIQRLARAYRGNTGARPGRGSGPFANFVSEFMAAVGQTDFQHASVIDAIQDAHRQFKPSWFDREPPYPWPLSWSDGKPPSI